MVYGIGESGKAYHMPLSMFSWEHSVSSTLSYHKSYCPVVPPQPSGQVYLILVSNNKKHIFTKIVKGKGTPGWKGRLEPDCGKELAIASLYDV